MPWYPHRLSHLALVLAACLLLAGDLSAAEFTGDLIMASTTRNLAGRITVKDSVYRMDIVEGAGTMFIIVNQFTNESYVCNPSGKNYRMIPTKSPASLQNDPFQAARYGDSIGVREYRGQDTINGWACDRYVIRLGPNPIMTEWVASELSFPVRIENMMAADSAYVAVHNISVGTIDTMQLILPADYVLLEEKPAPPPGGVKAGEQQRQQIDPSLPVEVALVNYADGESVCVVELLKDGRPMDETAVGPAAQRTFAFAATGAQTRRIYDVGADAVIVRVTSGEVAVEIVQPQ